jgi:hypothetical protein
MEKTTGRAVHSLGDPGYLEAFESEPAPTFFYRLYLTFSCLAVPLLPGASYAVVCALRGQISIFFSFYFISFGAVSGFLLVVHSTNRADVLV